MSYKILFAKSVKKDLKRIPTQYQVKILEAIKNLSVNPYPETNHKKLKGSEHSYRLRVGDYRILYDAEDEIRIISVYKIGHRKDVYR